MTDDQLDALEKRLRKHLLAGGGNGIFEAADAIASLRAKLAAEKTRADDAEVEEKNIRMAAHFFVEQRDAALCSSEQESWGDRSVQPFDFDGGRHRD